MPQGTIKGPVIQERKGLRSPGASMRAGLAARGTDTPRVRRAAASGAGFHCPKMAVRSIVNKSNAKA